MTQEIYTYNYFTHSDGIRSWRAKNLKFGDALAALAYAHGITWEQMVNAFPDIFGKNSMGKFESDGYLLDQQMQFLEICAVRKPKKILEIGGGRGEVATVLKYLGIDVVSVEFSADADKLYKETGNHFFGETFVPVDPISKSITDAIHDINLAEFDTIIMVESLEHIPEPAFDPVWNAIVEKFHGLFIVVNWIDYHPMYIGSYASPQEHCRVIDDPLYDQWTSQAKQCIHRNGSHLVLKF